jgi:hypothetical protein
VIGQDPAGNEAPVERGPSERVVCAVRHEDARKLGDRTTVTSPLEYSRLAVSVVTHEVFLSRRSVRG